MRKYRKKKSKCSPTRKVRVNMKPLNKDLWVTNTTEVADLRNQILESNGNKCELTGEAIKRPTLDHDHSTGLNRGVISQHNNTMEGYVLKYFNKFVRKHTELSLPDWLRCLADYYETDFLRGLHFRTLHDVQKRLSYMTKENISSSLIEDFNIKADHNKLTQAQLIELYSEALVSELEQQYQEYIKEVSVEEI